MSKRKNKKLLPYMAEFKGIEVSKVTVSYTQQGDCCENEDNFQTLTLTSEDNGCAPFIRMSITENDHFSVDSINDLQKIFADFNRRLNYVEPKICKHE
jgi:hypothetical protein